jgi:hypothetical protein
LGEVGILGRKEIAGDLRLPPHEFARPVEPKSAKAESRLDQPLGRQMPKPTNSES